jgi:SulP family sulfate permease
MIKSALMLAVLGSIDSLLTSLVADNITHTHHKSDRELIGQGIGNTIAGFFGGLPGAGATMRTVVNVRAGGLTPISGALHAIVLLAMVLGAGTIARYIPHALLAGILIKVGTDIIDWDYVKRIRTVPLPGIVVMLTVFFITVFVDLITAVAVGMIMTSFIFMQRMVDLQLDSVTAITNPHEENPLSEEEAELLKAAGDRILFYHISGPMSFGAAKGMARILADFEDYDVLILDLSDVPHIDFTSCRALEDILFSAWEINSETFLVDCKKPVYRTLRKQGIVKRFEKYQLKAKRIDALKDGLKIVQERQAK